MTEQGMNESGGGKRDGRARRKSNYPAQISRDGDGGVFNLWFWREKTDEGQSEMDGRRGGRKINVQGKKMERGWRDNGGGEVVCGY